jgi:hypothetical protein
MLSRGNGALKFYGAPGDTRHRSSMTRSPSHGRSAKPERLRSRNEHDIERSSGRNESVRQ